MFEKTKALCDSFLELGIPGFDLMVCKNGQCVLRYQNGYSDLHNKIPMQGSELFNLYSCSKPITCSALMQLWEKGLFRLDDRLSDYMPEFAEMTVRTENGIEKAKNPIRIRDLFTMTAGFDYRKDSQSLLKLRAESEGRCPTREVARALAQEPLVFEPGTGYLYSLGHDVLAALLEVLTGEKFEDYVKAHIFDPLGMTHSTFLLPLEDYKNVSPVYRGTPDGVIPHYLGNVVSYRLGIEHASGGAGCVSTVEDYMKFAEALREGERLLKRDTVRLMTTNHLTEEQLPSFKLSRYKYGYGLGMRVAREGSGLYDFGWGGAAGAFLAVDIPHGISLFYIQHVLSAPNVHLRKNLYLTVLEELEGIVSSYDAAGPDPENITY